MGGRETFPCPHCGAELSMTTNERANGSLDIHWPRATYEHVQGHNKAAK